jgi:hypothetical protein
VGKVDIRYYVTRGGEKPGTRKWGYWAPCLARRSKISGKIEPTLMAELGFRHADCGEDGPLAWARAESWNRKWDEAYKAHRAGVPQDPLVRIYPPGSLGEAFAKFRATATWAKKKPRTREDWERGWKRIDPVFGDVDPATVALDDLDGWYDALLDSIGVREAHRAMKIWRALYAVISSLDRTGGERYVSRKDPSLGIRRETPVPRSAIWYEGEAVRLAKRAWRMGYKGLAAALAVSWDTMLSPVDVRGLTTAQLSPDPQGPLFSLARAKTGKAAIGTLSRRAERLLAAYIASLPATLHPDMPIFHTRGAGTGPAGGRPRLPAPYTKDTLSKDFRIVREAEFHGDKRTIMDFRRSGAVEATAGKVDPAALAGKMANSIDTNRDLQATYQPGTASLVRLADEARARGRTLMRGTGKQRSEK